MRELDDLDLGLHPDEESLRRLIGDDLLAELSIAFGSSLITVPRTAGPNSPIAAVVGLDAARKISHVWGGITFTVPAGAGQERQVLALRAQGVSINMIARRLKFSRARVARILKRAFDQNQLSLFDD